MIWVSWRQHRMEVLFMGSACILAVIFLLVAGLTISHTFHQLGLDTCLARIDSDACAPVEVAFTNQYANLTVVPELIGILLTILFGIFVGAPMVARELEQGTHRLAWTQSITRLRWLSVKFMLTLVVGILMFGLLSVLLYWWFTPLYLLGFTNRLTPPGFDAMGPVFPASAALALALGILAGALTRRTVLAMLLTLVLVLAIRIPVQNILRPNYLPAITVTSPLDAHGEEQSISGTGKWIIEVGMLDPQGNKTNQASCPGALQQCGYRSYYIYQPEDRYWTFQWIETGIYLAIVVLALGATIWLVKRQLN